MKRKTFSLAFLLLFSSLTFAQFTTVTGTVVDPNGLPYALGTITPLLVLAGGTPTLNAIPYIQPTQATGLDGTGHFTVQLADNTALQPPGSTWNFMVCSAGGTIQPAGGRGPVCFSLSAPITISGSSQDISTQLSSAAVALSNITGGGGACAAASVNPPSIQFGTQQTGQASPAQSVTISNICTTPITVLGVTLPPGSDYFSSNPLFCNHTLVANASCVFSLQLRPTAPGPEPATSLTVTTSAPIDPQNPLTIALTGSGSATPTFPLTIDCGTGTGSFNVATNENPPLISLSCANGVPTGVASNNYVSGSVPSVQVTPLNGSTFVTFAGGGCATTNPCPVTVSAATTVVVTVTAPVPTVNLNLTSLGPGTVTVTSDVADAQGILNCISINGVVSPVGNSGCGLVVPVGTPVTLTAVLGGSSSLLGWTGASACLTNALTCVVTPSKDTTVQVNSTLTTVPIALVNAGFTTLSGSGTTVTYTFATQHAGGMDVCFIAAGQVVTGAVDTAGNTWAALNTKTTTGSSSQIAWGSNNIAATNPNTVTVTFAGAQTFRSLRCLSYDGIITSAGFVDATANGTGTSATPAAGNLTTTQNNDLLVCGTTSQQSVQTADSTYVQEVLDAPFNDDSEDRQGVPTGTYNCQPKLTGSTTWVTQNIAFKAQQTTNQVNNFSLTIVGNGLGSGTLTIPGSTCTFTAGTTPGCSVQVAANSTPVITAFASPGSAFGGYGGVTGCSFPVQCTVPAITAPTQLSVTFNLSGTNAYYVNPSGSDSNSGLCPAAVTGCSGPFATLNKAISAFQLGASGTVIHVANGTYSGAVTVTRGGSSPTVRLVMQCDNGIASYQAAVGKCMFTAAGAAFTLAGGNNFDIVGFDIGGNGNQFEAIDGLVCGAAQQSTCNNSVHVIANYIHDLAQNISFDSTGCSPFGQAPGAILILNNHNHFVTDLQVLRNAIIHYGPAKNNNCNTGPNGMYIDTQGAIVEGNLVINTYLFGLQYYGQPCSGSVSNNTFINNRYAWTISGSGEGICTKGNMTMNNNISVGETQGHFIAISTFPCTDSAHQSFFGSNITDGVNPDFLNEPPASCNTISPPSVTHASGASLFVNYQTDGSGNYALKGGSPGLGTGTKTCVSGAAINPCTPAVNILGVASPVPPNVGAF